MKAHWRKCATDVRKWDTHRMVPARWVSPRMTSGTAPCWMAGTAREHLQQEWRDLNFTSSSMWDGWVADGGTLARCPLGKRFNNTPCAATARDYQQGLRPCFHQRLYPIQEGGVVILFNVVVVPQPGCANSRPVAVSAQPTVGGHIGTDGSRMAKQRDGVALDHSPVAVRAWIVGDVQPQKRHPPDVGADAALQARFRVFHRGTSRAQLKCKWYTHRIVPARWAPPRPCAG